MLLIIMRLVLACLSQGGCEPRFLETKASISKAPCGFFFFSFFLQCSVYAHSPQCALHITRYHSLRPRSVSSQSLGSCTSLSYPISCWSGNVLVGNFAWCNNEEILSGGRVIFLCLWFPEIPPCFFTHGNKRLQMGFVCFPRAVWLSCHLATPDNFAATDVVLEGDLLSLSFALSFFSLLSHFFHINILLEPTSFVIFCFSSSEPGCLTT